MKETIIGVFFILLLISGILFFKLQKMTSSSVPVESDPQVEITLSVDPEFTEKDMEELIKDEGKVGGANL